MARISSGRWMKLSSLIRDVGVMVIDQRVSSLRGRIEMSRDIA